MPERPMAKIALLTPVPLRHLISGLETCHQSGQVTYGSNAVSRFENFRRSLNPAVTADIYFYASHAGGSHKPMATYKANFIHWVSATANGLAPADYKEFRPTTTARDKSWKSFYIVSNLERLAKPIPIRKLKGRGKSDYYTRTYYPRGPMIIDNISHTKT